MLATTSCARPAGCSEPSMAWSSVIAGRLESAANCMVSSIGAAVSATPGHRHHHEHRRRARADSAAAARRLTTSAIATAASTKHSSIATWLRPSAIDAATNENAAPSSERAARERELQQQQRQREQSVAQDDAGVLQPSRGGAAEHEHHRRQHAGGDRPARARADRRDRQAADQQMRVDDEIERAQRRRRVEQRLEHQQRREDQRLRIGDARMAAIVIGIPERRRAGLRARTRGSERTRRTGSWNPRARRCR